MRSAPKIIIQYSIEMNNTIQERVVHDLLLSKGYKHSDMMQPMVKLRTQFIDNNNYPLHINYKSTGILEYLFDDDMFKVMADHIFNLETDFEECIEFIDHKLPIAC